MKRVILFAFALLTIGSAFAQKVSVGDVDVMPGRTGSFAVSLSDGKADKYTAMTLNVEFPATGFTTVTNKINISNSWNATYEVGAVDSEGKATIPFSSSSPIPGTAVNNLVTIYFNVANDVQPGEYEVTLKGTMFEYNTSDKDYAQDVTFKVIVSDHLVLRETSTTLPVIAAGGESFNQISVHRTFKAGEWSTICLPFPMPQARLKAAFGDNYQLMEFTGYEVEKDGDIVTGLTLNFNASTVARKNTPYLIKPSRDTDITNFDVQGQGSTLISVSFEEVKKSIKIEDPETLEDVEIASMNGVYQAGTIVPANSLFLSGNKFYYSAGKTKMKAFRAYFTLQDVLTDVANAASRITLSFDDSETAGIKTVDKKNSDKYYNLRGQQVETPAKGVYVKDGKKVIIK